MSGIGSTLTAICGPQPSYLPELYSWHGHTHVGLSQFPKLDSSNRPSMCLLISVFQNWKCDSWVWCGPTSVSRNGSIMWASCWAGLSRIHGLDSWHGPARLLSHLVISRQLGLLRVCQFPVSDFKCHKTVVWSPGLLYAEVWFCSSQWCTLL